MPFFDLQVNGFAGVDFNAPDLTTGDVASACRRMRDAGIEGFLATVISADLSEMEGCLRRLARGWDESADIRSTLVGIHIEGPFLNPAPGYVGAHPPAAMRAADCGTMQRLLDAARGLTKLVTLAPEADPGFAVTAMLADRGIVVSAGHCDPTCEQLRGAIDAGVSMFTHLGNGCPGLLPRHDNVIQRVLSFADRLRIMFIADGVHVPFPALGNYLRCAGHERAVIVSDAISAAGMGPGIHRLGKRSVVVDESLATWAEDRSHLVGSAITMAQAAENLANRLGLDDAAVRRLTYENPRTALGLGHL